MFLLVQCRRLICLYNLPIQSKRLQGLKQLICLFFFKFLQTTFFFLDKQANVQIIFKNLLTERLWRFKPRQRFHLVIRIF